MAAERVKPGGNEGVRVLEDFPCDAICATDFPGPAAPGRGVNADIKVLAEFPACESRPALAAERTAELQGLANSNLLALVRLHGSELSAEELKFIHDIAIARLIQQDVRVSQGADEVSREAMQATLSRIAS
jgi:hypothetical protein